jgi:hypothetical protein
MKYYYIKNLRSRDVTTTPDISKEKSTTPSFTIKPKYRTWCANENTDHVFYSTVEGCQASERVAHDNPPRMIYGVVGDYDAAVDWTTVEDKLSKLDVPPTWITKTWSDYMRLVWEFEAPVPTTEDLCSPFMKEISLALGMKKIHAGLDSSSLKPTQYFELGTQWRKIGVSVPSTITQTSMLKAASVKPPQSNDTAIPIGVLAAEVKERFPDRWKTDFEVGQRGPLFWIDDGIEREGCQVSEDGMVCYSDRAGKGFLSWREIFGSQFVKDYENQKMGSLLDEYWYNGKSHFKILYDQAVSINEQQLVRELKQAGFNSRRQRGRATTEVEDAILTINNVNRVNDIAPVIFSKERIVHYNSNRILNTGHINPIHPSKTSDPVHWPFLNKWLRQLFENSGDRPTIDYFLAWLQRFYVAVTTPTLTQGQALLLVGPTNRGKSLLSNKVISALVGGFADASEYLSGASVFNKDLARVAAWVVDDTTSAAQFQDQLKATELIKRAVANPRMEYMAKYADSMSLPWTGRVVMSLNMDANSLSVIPALDSSNRDKIMALLISEDSTTSFPPNHILEATIAQELPHFASWLLEWEPPEEVLVGARFGVKSFIDEKIANAAYDNSSRSSVAELVDFFARGVRNVSDEGRVNWSGTLTEFLNGLLNLNEGRHVGRSNNPEFIRRGLSSMEEATKSNPLVRPVWSVSTGGGTIWYINIEHKYDIHELEKLLSTSSYALP